MTAPWIVAFVALWVVVLLLAVLVLGLLRRVGPVLERAERAVRLGDAMHDLGGLEAGTPVPSFEVVDAAGRRLPFADAGPSDRVVLFVDAGCPACTVLAGKLEAFPKLAQLPLIVVTGQGTPADHYAGLAAAGVRMFNQPDDAASKAFAVRAMPFAAAVSDGVVVGSGVPGDPGDLENLAGELGHRHGRNEGALDGSPVHTHT